VNQEQQPRQRSFIRELVPDWRPTREQKLSASRIIFVLVVLLGALILVGLPFDVTLWNWLDLLIVPIVLALGGFLFTRSENRRTQDVAERQRAVDREIADQRAQTDREIANQSRQDDALQEYFNHIGELLLDKDKPLRQSKEGDEMRTLARARSLTVLRRLDTERKSRVLQFLNEAQLITTKRSGAIFAQDHGLLDLAGADLSSINLYEADLSWTDLGGANLGNTYLESANLGVANLSSTDLSGALLGWANLHSANLRSANLYAANLDQADLRKAILTEADLSTATPHSANLTGTNLYEADLGGAELFAANLTIANLRNADLSEARLTGANLSGAYLSGANLREADLRDANLEGARSVTGDQLAEASSLEGATMPNGQKYEDWLKDKEGHGDDRG
jgi:uncharacterized protein YjbI with pentapeptide repeats